jgi:hypothetical protein
LLRRHDVAVDDPDPGPPICRGSAYLSRIGLQRWQRQHLLLGPRSLRHCRERPLRRVALRHRRSRRRHRNHLDRPFVEGEGPPPSDARAERVRVVFRWCGKARASVRGLLGSVLRAYSTSLSSSDLDRRLASGVRRPASARPASSNTYPVNVLNPRRRFATTAIVRERRSRSDRLWLAPGVGWRFAYDCQGNHESTQRNPNGSSAFGAPRHRRLNSSAPSGD